jgi:hypothetical protein
MIQKQLNYDMRFRIDVELEIKGAFSQRTSFQMIAYKTNLWIDIVLLIENKVDDKWMNEELSHYPNVKRVFF